MPHLNSINSIVAVSIAVTVVAVLVFLTVRRVLKLCYPASLWFTVYLAAIRHDRDDPVRDATRAVRAVWGDDGDDPDGGEDDEAEVPVPPPRYPNFIHRN